MFTLWPDDGTKEADGVLRMNKAYPLTLPGIKTFAELTERLNTAAAKEKQKLLKLLEQYRLLWAKGPYARRYSV